MFDTTTSEKIKHHERELHQSLGLLMLSSTGLKHLHCQMTEDYNPIRFHELNAKLEKEIREEFSGDYISKIALDEEKSEMFLRLLSDIEDLRRQIIAFTREVNNG